MSINTKSLHCVKELVQYIEKGEPSLFVGSMTSTVINFSDLEKNVLCEKGPVTLVSLSDLPKKCHLDNKEELIIEGGVTWSEARAYCRSKGRDILVSPTEEMACVLSGVATSCTGERSFGFGPFRDHISSVEMIDGRGRVHELSSQKKLRESALMTSEVLEKLCHYQQDYLPYESFKNAPFPRLKNETDLAIGFEGQLGVITKAKIKTIAKENVSFLFVPLSKWEEDFSLHLKIWECVQKLRGKILSCELLDSNSCFFIDSSFGLSQNYDYIFLEVIDSCIEEVIEEIFIDNIDFSLDSIFRVDREKCQSMRRQIPRSISDLVSSNRMSKKGTDIQVSRDNFVKLLLKYREMASQGICYYLFGHFGDNHLHFNYLPKRDEEERCQKSLDLLYNWVEAIGGSPFAEHGVGLIKQTYMKNYYGEVQKDLFKLLKDSFDPQNIFFPNGFMSCL